MATFTNQPDVVLVGCIMSATLAVFLKELDPSLVAEDHTGSGHKWRLINDEPWRRAYVVFKKGADTQFVPDPA